MGALDAPRYKAQANDQLRIRRRKMMKLCVPVIALGAATALGGCSTQQPPAAGQAAASNAQCFLPSQVNGWAPSGNGYVDVQVGANRYYRLALGGGCPNVNWNTSVGIRSTGGGSFICQGYDAELIVPDPQGTQRCPISSITPISRDQYYASKKS
jgi:hypothetical protein